MTRKKTKQRIGVLTTARCVTCYKRFQTRKTQAGRVLSAKCRSCYSSTSKPHTSSCAAKDMRLGETVADYLERKDREGWGIYG